MTTIPTDAELERFLDKVRATLRAAQSGKGAAPRGRPGRPPGRPPGRRARRGALDGARLLALLAKAKGGLSAGQLAAALGGESRPRVLAALNDLRSTRRVVLVGKRRGAKWLQA